MQNIGSKSGDLLTGSVDNDVLSGKDGGDYIDGVDGNDLLLGGRRGDVLLGGLGDDVIVGGRGGDFIVGGEGNDVLQGGRGHDVFQFSIGPDGTASGVDRILDFRSTKDILAIDCPNPGQSTAFYVMATGAIYFDQDGTGGVAPVLIAAVKLGLFVDVNDLALF